MRGPFPSLHHDEKVDSVDALSSKRKANWIISRNLSVNSPEIDHFYQSDVFKRLNMIDKRPTPPFFLSSIRTSRMRRISTAFFLSRMVVIFACECDSWSIQPSEGVQAVNRKVFDWYQISVESKADDIYFSTPLTLGSRSFMLSIINCLVPHDVPCINSQLIITIWLYLSDME